MYILKALYNECVTQTHTFFESLNQAVKPHSSFFPIPDVNLSRGEIEKLESLRTLNTLVFSQKRKEKWLSKNFLEQKNLVLDEKEKATNFFIEFLQCQANKLNDALTNFSIDHPSQEKFDCIVSDCYLFQSGIHSLGSLFEEHLCEIKVGEALSNLSNGHQEIILSDIFLLPFEMSPNIATCLHLTKPFFQLGGSLFSQNWPLYYVYLDGIYSWKIVDPTALDFELIKAVRLKELVYGSIKDLHSFNQYNDATQQFVVELAEVYDFHFKPPPIYVDIPIK